MPFQANADGTLFDGDNPAHLDDNEKEGLLNRGLSIHDWSASITKSNPGGRFSKFTATAKRGDVQLLLHCYLFPVSWATRPTRLYEQRIQITRPYSEHEDDFSLDNSGSEKCLLMGTYSRDGVEIFVAWDKNHYLNHAQPTSCYIDVRSIAKAMRDGFAQWRDSNNSLVCCFREEFLHFYLMNMEFVHETALATSSQAGVSEQQVPTGGISEITDESPARNRIIYGAPGTGKSYNLDIEIKALFPEDDQRKRVTFYPEYLYSQLIGSFRPVPIFRESGSNIFDTDRQTQLNPSLEPMIDYRFVPGPLLELYVKAIKNPDNRYVLVIEELNRADAAGVFGDFFQLLDRDRQSGASVYSINLPSEVSSFLVTQGISQKEIFLPGNLYIWCTMNSADQGVMPLDAAFKRRWSFEYLPLNEHEDLTSDWELTLSAPACRVKWNDFRSIINNALTANNVPEDRLMGPFFLSKGELDDPEVFKNKVLLYLREDVLRHEPEMLFLGESMTFSGLVDRYDNGRSVFKGEIHSSLENVAIEVD
jgi:hypothetical protein